MCIRDRLYTQIDVVLEEKKQTCDDTPYGNSTTQLRNISFDKNHPYSWDTIGTEEDIKDATLEKVEMFYNQYYTPNNSTLVITCLLYTSPSPRDRTRSRMPSSA